MFTRGILMKVLLVDDAEFARMTLKRLLDDCGFNFQYVEASTGVEAIQMYRRILPDLVIMDINMPGMDGITAVREIIKIDKESKIVMCSSLGYQQKVDDAIAAGAMEFIVKPYQKETVVSAIEKVFGLS